MRLHVWAVFDFMVLLGRLRQAFAPSGAFWVPPLAHEATRAVNEIVLAEESDPHPAGGHRSHFELYLSAMAEVDADVIPILRFLERTRRGQPLADALRHPTVPAAAREFSLTTLALARHVPTAAAAFCFGREQLLPGVCASLLAHTNGAPLWADYLVRHVDLDGAVHGPAAEAILVGACPTRSAWHIAEGAIDQSLAARLNLWDAAHVAVRSA